MNKSEERQFLDAIRKVFKDSDLLKGQPPQDKILVKTLSPELLENLKEMAKLDPIPEDQKKMAIEHVKKQIRKSTKPK